MAVSAHFEFFYEPLNRRSEDMDILFIRKFNKSVIKPRDCTDCTDRLYKEISPLHNPNHIYTHSFLKF